MANIARPIATHARHYTKQERLEREMRENDLRTARDDLRPPAWLGDAARAEFCRVVDEAGKIGLLDNMDKSVLALYAHTCQLYEEAAAHLKIEGLAPGGKLNPYQKAATDAAKIILQCSSKLGLACTDRLKIAVPKRKKESPVNKWLPFLPQHGAKLYDDDE